MSDDKKLLELHFETNHYGSRALTALDHQRMREFAALYAAMFSDDDAIDGKWLTNFCSMVVGFGLKNILDGAVALREMDLRPDHPRGGWDIMDFISSLNREEGLRELRIAANRLFLKFGHVGEVVS